MADELEVTTQQAADALADGSATVVDVREDDERAAGHIEGTVHIPLGELSARADEVPDDKPVFFQCLSGGRSLMAAQAFEASGRQARSVAGGISQWDAEGRPVAGGGAVQGH